MAGKLTVNRHPVLIDNETQVAFDLQPGESLYSFLYRHIENLDGQQVAVTVNGQIAERDQWHALKPKDGANVYVRFVVQKSALAIVALVALSVFTAGAAAAIAGDAVSGMGGAFGAFLVGNMGALAANAVVGAIQIVGAMLINKVLGPKPASAGNMERDSVFSFSGSRNGVRQYEPLGLLFGSVRVTPDTLSIPYTWYKDNDQYMGMVLTPGVNVDRFEQLHIGETPLSNYENVTVTTAGFSGMPEQQIPLYSNVDTLDGGTLEATFGVPGAWIERTGPRDTIRLQVNLSFLLFDLTSKGKKKYNQETVVAQYREVGTENWAAMGSYYLRSQEQTEQRRSFSLDVPRGQYEIRVRRMGGDTDGSGATCEMNLAGVSFIQADDAAYNGIARIGLEMRATGQLNGSPSQVRGVMHARTMPYWDGGAWVDATAENGGLSNPGAQILQYVRGFRDADGNLLAGMGLSDDLVDIESFKAFTDHCRVNGFRYDQWITDARSHDDIINNIARAAMGRYSWAPGRLTMLWVAEGQPHEGVATMANIKSGEFQIDYSLSQAADGIEYTYVDRETWESKSLRVPAPGITVMENPARLSGEGVSSEAHAATLARYHLAQNLYQFKDIVFGQDLEHMAYGELSVVMLSHDLTQWGFSGRLMAASRTADGILLELDEDVPAGSDQTPYVGLRIPGEGNYRVFEVVRVASNLLRLVGSWPAGVAFPGEGAGNPAHDTIWLYDFKQTPGLRCRVIGVAPADNLNGASISVVPESDEFWHYVKTGEYFPPQNDSLLKLQPTVRNLRVTEEVISQGNTVFSNIHASWLTEGVADRFTVSVAGEDGIYRELTSTTGLAHQWRMDSTGQITVLVRPFDKDGVPGVAQSAMLTVYGADKPPVQVSSFDVLELSGGVRKYTWDFHADVIQSPDTAGVEVRMLEGHVYSPDWETMVPVGETGFYTAPFEATIPEAGAWTFAVRTINTNGILAENPYVIHKTLGNNLGEVIGKVEDDIDAITQAQVDAQMALDAEVLARLQGDLNAVSQAGADATAKANAARDAAMAYADGLNAGISDLLQADEWNDVDVYPAGDFVQHDGKLYRSLIDGNLDIEPGTDPLAWELLGNYASVGEAVAVSLSMSTQNASDIAAESSRLDQLGVRVGDAEVGITTVNQARIDGDVALGLRVDAVTVTANDAQSTATNAMTVANDAATIASTAQTTANGAQSTATTALNTANGTASQLGAVQTDLASVTEHLTAVGGGGNLISNSFFAADTAGWSVGWGQTSVNWERNWSGVNMPGAGVMLGVGTPAQGAVGQSYFSSPMSVDVRNKYIGSAYVASSGNFRAYVILIFYDAVGNELPSAPSPQGAVVFTDGGQWSDISLYERLSTPAVNPPAGAATCRIMIRAIGLGGGVSAVGFTKAMVEQVADSQTLPSPWSAGGQEMAATHTISLDVNGHISGTQSINDGKRSVFSVLATVFRVISNVVSAGMEWQDGYLRMWKGSAQLVMGHSFGSGELVFWYGPNVGAGNCTKANATIWFDSAGGAYFGGTLAAGILKNAAQSSEISSVASVTVGPFGTNGRQKVVTWGLSFNNNGFEIGTNPGNATLTGTVVLDRSTDNGNSWVQISSLPVTGNRTSYYDNELGRWFVDVLASASGTFTDNTAGTQNFMYRVRVTAANGWPWIINNGGATSYGTQRTYVQSVEQ